MLAQYPETPEAAKDKIIHTKNCRINKTGVDDKIKGRFRQAIVAGFSGHGRRVVFLYFDLCEHIWGGSPATEQILSQVESKDIDREVANDQ